MHTLYILNIYLIPHYNGYTLKYVLKYGNNMYSITLYQVGEKENLIFNHCIIDNLYLLTNIHNNTVTDIDNQYSKALISRNIRD